MTLILECKSPTKKHRWVLRPGELARIGKSPWVEFSVSEDVSLSQEHFSISYLDQIVVQSLIDATIDINGHDVSNSTIDSRTVIKAGESSFLLTLASYAPPSLRNSIDTPGEARNTLPTVAWENKREIFERIGLSSRAIESVDSNNSSVDMVRKLYMQDDFEDAIRLLTVLMQTHESIRWCYEQLLDQSSFQDAAMQAAVEQWIDDPSEEHRVHVSSYLDSSKLHSSSTHWLLASIVWTNGSLAPSDSSPVKPPIDLIWSAIVTALNLTAATTIPSEFRRAAVEVGIDRLTKIGEEAIQHHLRGIS